MASSSFVGVFFLGLFFFGLFFGEADALFCPVLLPEAGLPLAGEYLNDLTDALGCKLLKLCWDYMSESPWLKLLEKFLRRSLMAAAGFNSTGFYCYCRAGELLINLLSTPSKYLARFNVW